MGERRNIVALVPLSESASRLQRTEGGREGGREVSERECVTEESERLDTVAAVPLSVCAYVQKRPRICAKETY